MTLHRIGSALFQDGNPQALERIAEAIAIHRSLGDAAGVASGLNTLGRFHSVRGEMRKARESYDEAIALARALGNRRMEAMASAMPARHRQYGDAQKALDYFTRSLALGQALTDAVLQANPLNNMGVAYRDLGDYRSALECFAQTLALLRSLGGVPDLDRESRVMLNMADLHQILGESGTALDLYRQVLVIARRLPSMELDATALTGIAESHSRLEEPRTARESAEAALPPLAASERSRRAGVCPRHPGRAWRQLGDSDKALASLREALRIERESEDRYAEPNTLINLATVERDRGDLSEALAHAQAAISRTEALRSLVAGPETRASFVASAHDKHQFHVDLLMAARPRLLRGARRHRPPGQRACPCPRAPRAAHRGPRRHP
jgi:tetratricopeptide (TPR) repeat protein